MSKNLKVLNLIPLSLHPSKAVGPLLRVKPVVGLPGGYPVPQPRPQQGRQTDDYQVQRTEHPALEHMPELMPHRQFLTRPYYNALTEGDTARKRGKEIEPDVPEPVPRLPFENKQEQQPQQVQRKLPQVQKYLPEHPYGYGNDSLLHI